jgi:8-oxo-dGTP pyrophosphatase MutT (NUDIX family)
MFPVSIKGVFSAPSGEVVLLLNERGEWELPGGRIEIGESSVACLRREILEELNVAVSVETLLDTYLFEVVPHRYVFIVTYGCRCAGDFNPIISHEHKRLGLFEPTVLPQNLPAGYRASIEAWRANPRASVTAQPTG